MLRKFLLATLNSAQANPSPFRRNSQHSKDIVACREIGVALNILASTVSLNLNKRETQ